MKPIFKQRINPTYIDETFDQPLTDEEKRILHERFPDHSFSSNSNEKGDILLGGGEADFPSSYKVNRSDLNNHNLYSKE